MLVESGNDIMSITVNGQSRVPPGFRFHPTEEELLSYYLRKKVAGGKIDLDVIREVDLNKLEPWDIQERCRIGSTPQNDWYFFSHKDKKYPTGTRTNRATAAGFWKATGRDKIIYAGGGRVGMRKTLVFYRGRAPHGQKCDWIMHEYRLDEPPPPQEYYSGSQLSKCFGTMGNAPAPAPPEDGWVVCRVFKKKNHHDKVPGSSTKNSSSVTSGDAKSSTQVLHSNGDETLDQILQYLQGRSCKQESNDINAINPTVLGNSTTINNNDAGSRRLRYLRPTKAAVALNGRHQADERLMKLPALEPPSLPSSALLGDLCPALADQSSLFPSDGLHALLNLEKSCLLPHDDSSVVNDWAALDRLVASHLGAAQPPETSKTLLAGCSFEVEEEVGFGGPCCSANTSSLLSVGGCQEYQQGDMDLWALAPAVVGGRPTGPPLPNPKYSVPM